MRCWACGGRAGASARIEALAECPACGHLFTPEVRREELRELYDPAYFSAYAGAGYEAVERQRRHEARVRLRLLHEARRPPGRLLEVGAAAGYFLDEAREVGWEVSGIEPAQEEARRAREDLALDVRIGVLEEAPLEPGSLDAVCAFHVLEHIVEPLPTLARLRAALRPEAAVVVEVPNGGSVIARRLGADWPILGLPYHVSQFTPASLRALLERAGLRVLRSDTVPFSAYYPRAMALSPRHLAHRALLSVRVRALGRTHPHKHELLRAVARPA